MSAVESWVGSDTTSNCFAVLTSWVEALHGHGEMTSVMDAFVGLFNCEAALLVRIAQGAGTGSCIAKAISAPQKLFPPRMAMPLIHEISHPYFSNVIRGTVWRYSDHNDRATWKSSDTLDDLMHQQSITDVIVVALETKAMTWDFLEFHFSTEVPSRTMRLFDMLVQSLAKSWASRVPGLAAKLQNRLRLVKLPAGAPAANAPILNMKNPAGLSRSEYRICSLIQEGMRVKRIANELAIRQTTVRSHLHSIYAKTETSGQMELLHRLSQDRISMSVAAGQL